MNVIEKLYDRYSSFNGIFRDVTSSSRSNIDDFTKTNGVGTCLGASGDGSNVVTLQTLRRASDHFRSLDELGLCGKRWERLPMLRRKWR